MWPDKTVNPFGIPPRDPAAVEEPEGEFVVVENTPGYLPESEPIIFDSYSEAVAYVNELADELEVEGYITDRSWASRDNYYAVNARRNRDDLGRVIEIVRSEQ